MKKIDFEEVMENFQQKRCYGVFLIDEGTNMTELSACDFFAMEEPEAPTPLEKLKDGEPITAEEEKVAVEELKFPPVKKPGKRIPIDDGKIKALRDAGWSINKIADEMGIAYGTIYGHLKKMEGVSKYD